jgi:hypothetical protein
MHCPTRRARVVAALVDDDAAAVGGYAVRSRLETKDPGRSPVLEFRSCRVRLGRGQNLGARAGRA